MGESTMTGVDLQAEVEECRDCDYPELCPAHEAAREAMRGFEVEATR